MQATRVPELDVVRIVATYERRVDVTCPDELPLALRSVRRLTPANWTLEWYLPWWLGHALGLDAGVSEEIVLSNVLGLVSIRLEDDLLDAEVAPEDVSGARRLVTALFDEALAVYRRRFDGSSPFWAFLERSMAEWRRASVRNPAMAAVDLSSRGAPLKVPAFAICLLTDRLDRWELVERCLDDALAALVRYDQVCDWEDDLAAGRPNAFVAALSARPQNPAHLEPNRTMTLAAMMTRGVVAAQFGRIEADAVHAARIAAELGSPPLSAYLSGYATRTAAQGAEMEAHYQGAADRATALIFGSGRERAVAHSVGAINR